MNKLSLAEVEQQIEYLERPAAHIVRKDALMAFKQLADTMRENERLWSCMEHPPKTTMDGGTAG